MTKLTAFPEAGKVKVPPIVCGKFRQFSGEIFISVSPSFVLTQVSQTASM
ncbi:MAG: hypothetical protein GW827_13350 [Flavobacteriales bacterium]|nr:hypothetical protein [Flavobacteriales bacterium]